MLVLTGCISLPNSSPLPKSEFSKQPIRLLETKLPIAITPLLLLISPSILRMTYSRFLKLFWRLKLPLFFSLQLLPQLPTPLKSPEISYWRPVPRTYIVKSPTWTATTSVSNLRTISLPLELWRLIKFFLPHPSSKTGWVCAGSNTSKGKTQTAQSQPRRTSSRHSSAKA